MSSTNNNTTNWLKRWISGDATAKDVKALEEQQKGDPFLNDAMDGYRQFAGSDHQARLHKLKKNIPTQQQSSFTTISKVAASAAILLVCVVAITFLLPQQNTTLSEKSIPQKTLVPTNPIDKKIITTETAEEETIKKETPSISQEKNISPQKPTTASQPQRSQKTTPKIIAQKKKIDLPSTDQVILAETPSMDIAEEEEVMFTQEQLIKSAPKVIFGDTISSINDATPQYVIGRVKDIDDWPLEGVTIFSQDGQLVTTDNKGRFSLEWTEKLTTIDLARTGYTSIQQQITTSKDTLEIQLTPQLLAKAKTNSPIKESKKEEANFISTDWLQDIDTYLLPILKEKQLLDSTTIYLQLTFNKKGNITDVLPVGEYPPLLIKTIKEALLKDDKQWNNNVPKVFYQLELQQ